MQRQTHRTIRIAPIRPDALAAPERGAEDAEETTVRIGRLQVILKVVERCNLACTYCYYFFGEDQSYKHRPAVMKGDTIEMLARFLVQAARDLDIGEVQVIFHGGEPLMLKKRVFDAACSHLAEAFVGHKSKLQIGIQTNATLVDEEWIALFLKHNVFVGVSVDGPQEYHDEFRVDHKGRGSHARVVQGVQLLARHYNAGEKSLGLGAIVVLQPERDYGLVFDHLANDLGLKRTSFLLPDYTHDSIPYSTETIRSLGKRMCDIFDKWVDHPGVEVLQIQKVINFFQVTNEKPPIPTTEGISFVRNQIVDVQSDGALTADDSLVPAQAFRDSLISENIRTTSLKRFLAQQYFRDSWSAQARVPTACLDCAWKEVCRGGDMENRFSRRAGFDNPSVYCEALKTFYEHIVEYLIRSGYPAARIAEMLKLADDASSLEDRTVAEQAA